MTVRGSFWRRRSIWRIMVKPLKLLNNKLLDFYLLSPPWKPANWRYEALFLPLSCRRKRASFPVSKRPNFSQFSEKTAMAKNQCSWLLHVQLVSPRFSLAPTQLHPHFLLNFSFLSSSSDLHQPSISVCRFLSLSNTHISRRGTQKNPGIRHGR